MSKVLALYSGISGVAKGPSRKALKPLYPDIKFERLVLCTSRLPRCEDGVWEVHGDAYYFLPMAMFFQLDPQRFIVGPVRNMMQAIDMVNAREVLEKNNMVFIEVYPTLGRRLMEWASQQSDLDFEIRTIALQPMTTEELQARCAEEGKDALTVIYELTRANLVRRNTDDPADIEIKARSAYDEMLMMVNYTHKIINHTHKIINHTPEGAIVDDKDAWEDPLAPEPRRVVDELAAILRS